jgi:hypothetical protein
MLPEILKTADLYSTGIKNVENRREQWLKKHTELKDHLTEVAKYLNENTGYKQGFFVDTLHAFNEDMHGVCTEMPSITFRSGDMPMQVSFHNSVGERKEYIEEGFRISFTPAITGELIVLLSPHHSELDQEQPQVATIAVIKDPVTLTMDIADKLVNRAMQIAFYSSYTGVADLQQEEDAARLNVPRHNPIGFKRYETTEKVK